jgi:hypothetical protein
MTDRTPHEIEPMVPEMPRLPRTDGGSPTIAQDGGRVTFADSEADAPLVPDLS